MDPLGRNLCKAARALLGWTADDLAREGAVSLDTLRSFESGRTTSLSRTNEAAVRRAFQAAGVEFIAENGGGPGVRLSRGKGKGEG